jgi:universal stress protein A
VSAYQHILWAADFSPKALQVGKRAKELARRTGARLSLIHVIEESSISAGYEMIPVLPELPDDVRMEEARDALQHIAVQLELKDVKQWVIPALSTKEGVLKIATEKNVDLIVVGSHGRHGLALLLGSTANAVLHRAPCDVLAVRIHT